MPDRQAAEAVRSRIDWKYVLGLELTDPGFDFSVLCEFRTRLITGGAEQQLLDTLLKQFKERGWLKERGKQRTDSTHVLAAIRNLNRLEGVGETLRAALNDLATVSRFDSPYDIDARFGNKRSVTWTGYKVHLTETCDRNQVHLITHAITTQAQVSDVTQTALIHEALAAKDLLPSQHIVDAGYVDSNLIVTSHKRYGIDLVGPVRPNVSWQAKTHIPQVFK